MSDTNLADPPADETPIAGDPPADLQTPPAEAPSEPAPQGPRMVPVDVLVREVTPLRAKNRELESALDEHRRQLAEARGLLERFQRAPNGADPNASPAPAPRPTEQGYSQQDIDRRAAELNFQRDASAVSEAGNRAYGQRWADSINILGSFNLNTADFISAVMDVAGRDKTHEIVNEIAQNPETAATLASMTPTRRIAELTRMAERMTTKAATPATSVPVAPAAAPAKNVSKAPPPAPSVTANAGQVVDWRSDKASDEDFSKGWNERYLRRGDAIRR
jgi:hypothetical protein